jgi:hypothetical protein
MSRVQFLVPRVLINVAAVEEQTAAS